MSKVEVKQRKRPISCLLLIVELTNVLDTEEIMCGDQLRLIRYDLEVKGQGQVKQGAWPVS